MAVPNTSQVTASIYSTLSGDSTLTNMLGTFNSSTNIFTGLRVPSSTDGAFIHITLAGGAGTFDTKDKRGRSIDYSINCVTDAEESSLLLSQISDRVVNLLHRQALSLATDDLINIRLTNMTSLPTDESLIGMALTFNIIIMET